MPTAITWGYIRTSTEGQDLETQRSVLADAGVRSDRIFGDVTSGGTEPHQREGWGAMLERAREGDAVIVTEVSRVARTMRRCMGALWDLEERGIRFRSLKESITTDPADPIGGAMLQLFAVFAELERRLIQARTREGLRRARELGRVGGRPPSLSREQLLEAVGRRRQGASWAELGRLYGCHPTTVQRVVVAHEAANV